MAGSYLALGDQAEGAVDMATSKRSNPGTSRAWQAQEAAAYFIIYYLII
jgi:hypothetical protein